MKQTYILEIDNDKDSPYESHILESIINSAMFILKFNVKSLSVHSGGVKKNDGKVGGFQISRTRS